MSCDSCTLYIDSVVLVNQSSEQATFNIIVSRIYENTNIEVRTYDKDDNLISDWYPIAPLVALVNPISVDRTVLINGINRVVCSVEFRLYGDCPDCVPSAPRNVVATIVGSTILITWEPPLDIGGSPIIDYVLEFSIDNGNNWVLINDGINTSLSYAFSPFSSSLNYLFRVSATNDCGQGPPTNSNPIGPTTTPGPTTTTTATPTTTTTATPTTTTTATPTTTTTVTPTTTTTVTPTTTTTATPTTTTVSPCGDTIITIPLGGITEYGLGITYSSYSGNSICFTQVIPYGGLPAIMNIYIGGVYRAKITFTTPFLSKPLTFTNIVSGISTSYTTTFQVGDVFL